MKEDKITIGVDVDGVLADFMSALLKRVNKKHNVSLKTSDITYWDWCEDGINIYEEIVDASKDDDFMENMKPIKGSLEVMNELFEKYSIKIVTSRLPAAWMSTCVWLKKYFKFHDIIFTHGKDKTKDLTKVDILIDDRAFATQVFVEKGGEKAILFDQPHNREGWEAENIDNALKLGRIVRCETWREVKSEIEQFAATRRNIS